MSAARRVTFVLWDGQYFGGAETVTIALAERLAAQGLAVQVLFIGSPGVYGPLMARAGLSCAHMGLSTGAAVLWHPRRLARALGSHGAEVTVLTSAGFLARAVRLGGYRGVVIAVEHGGLLQFAGRTLREKARDIIDRVMGIGCVDAQVAVSHYLMDRLARVPHARRVTVIHNGVDLARFKAAADARGARRLLDDTVVLGVAGKLRQGKGVHDVIAAVSRMQTDRPWRLLVVGRGPLEGLLVEQAREAGLAERVEFRDWTDDMPSFWAECDVAIAASSTSIESFGMTVAEAFASGIPAIVSRTGALPEVLGDTGAGAAFDAGDVDGLSCAIARFVDDDEYRDAAAVAARERAAEFGVERMASEYVSLMYSLLEDREGGS